MATESKYDDFSEQMPNRNLALKVENKSFWISREALADVSPVFQRMLYGEFKEAKEDEFKLPDKKAEDVLEFLRCLFSGKYKRKRVDLENVLIILKYADEYEVNFLKDECEEVIMAKIQSLVLDNLKNHTAEKITLIDLFLVSIEYQFKNAIRKAIPAIARIDFNELADHFDRMPLSVRCAISMQMAGQTSDHRFAHSPVGEPCSMCGQKKFGTAASGFSGFDFGHPSGDSNLGVFGSTLGSVGGFGAQRGQPVLVQMHGHSHYLPAGPSHGQPVRLGPSGLTTQGKKICSACGFTICNECLKLEKIPATNVNMSRLFQCTYCPECKKQRICGTSDGLQRCACINQHAIAELENVGL